jgi:hypothetical protein
MKLTGQYHNNYAYRQRFVNVKKRMPSFPAGAAQPPGLEAER